MKTNEYGIQSTGRGDFAKVMERQQVVANRRI